MKRTLIITSLLLCAWATWAGPAPWYKWRSPLSESDICAQFSPGEGWVRIQGPFADAGCRKLGVPR